MATKSKSTKSVKSSKKAAAEKVVKASKKGAKSLKKASEKKAAGRDYLGSRGGSNCAAINAALSLKTPKSARELHEETGASLVLCRNHVQTLLRKGLIVRKDDGVVLVKDHVKKVAEKAWKSEE